MKEQAHKLIRTLAISLLLGATEPQSQTPQSPAQSQKGPAQTGRSYGTGDPSRRPPAPSPQSPSPITFTESTAKSGITFRHFASPTSQKYLIEAMGGGVALLDYDNDGRLDLFFTNGARVDDPMPKNAKPDKDAPGCWNRLYRQKADGTFEDVTAKAGVRGQGYSMGVAVGDYDNDGWADMFVGGYGAGYLYRNNGNGSFEETSVKSGVVVTGWATSAAFLDYDRDGRLDLFVARYLDWDFEKGTVYCGERREGYRAYCHPDNFNGVSNLLFHQRADGSFEDVSRRAGIATAIGKGLGVSVADFDDDGWPDIFVANDSVMQFLFHNLKNGIFEETALLAGAAYDENGKTFAGMGVDAVIRLEESLRIFPNSSRLWFALGIARFKQNQNEEAAQAFARASEMDRKFAAPLVYLGMTHVEKGRYEEAVDLYKQALAINDALGVVDYLIANALTKESSPDNASIEAHLLRAIRSEPNFAPARLSLAKVLMRADRLNEARTELERALALDANLAEAHYQLGLVYSRLRSRDDAKASMARFQQLSDSEKEQAMKERKEIVDRLSKTIF